MVQSRQEGDNDPMSLILDQLNLLFCFPHCFSKRAAGILENFAQVALTFSMNQLGPPEGFLWAVPATKAQVALSGVSIMIEPWAGSLSTQPYFPDFPNTFPQSPPAH